MKLIEGNDVTLEHVLGALKLDKEVYAQEYWLSESVCKAFAERNPDIYTMIFDEENGQVAAYLNVSPVSCLPSFVNTDLLYKYAFPVTVL